MSAAPQQLPVKKRATNMAFDILHELSIRRKDEPFDRYEATPIVLARLVQLVGESEDEIEAILLPIAEAAVRAADESMRSADAERMRRAQIGEMPIFFDYDPDSLLALGENERIAWRHARVDHVKRSLRLDTDNLVAVNAAFASKREYKQALIDVMEPLDPRTTVHDVVAPEADPA